MIVDPVLNYVDFVGIHIKPPTTYNQRGAVALELVTGATQLTRGTAGMEILGSRPVAPRNLEFSTSIRFLGTTNGLGGAPTTEVVSQNVIAPTISGVTGVHSIGNQLGRGVLSVRRVQGGVALSWTGNGGGETETRATVGSGMIDLSHQPGSSTGKLRLDVDLINAADGDHGITISPVRGAVLRNLSESDTTNAASVYRCFVIKNTNPQKNFSKVSLLVTMQPTSGVELYLGLDPAGVGQNPQVVADMYTEPTGVSWRLGVDIPLASQGQVGLWLKQTPVLGAVIGTNTDIAVITVEATQ